jgi:hypothetical protein
MPGADAQETAPKFAHRVRARWIPASSRAALQGVRAVGVEILRFRVREARSRAVGIHGQDLEYPANATSASRAAVAAITRRIAVGVSPDPIPLELVSPRLQKRGLEGDCHAPAPALERQRRRAGPWLVSDDDHEHARIDRAGRAPDVAVPDHDARSIRHDPIDGLRSRRCLVERRIGLPGPLELAGETRSAAACSNQGRNQDDMESVRRALSFPHFLGPVALDVSGLAFCSNPVPSRLVQEIENTRSVAPEDAPSRTCFRQHPSLR